jgi:hypothetical protein
MKHCSLFLIAFFIGTCIAWQVANGQEPTADQRLEAAKAKALDATTYDLRYKFSEGEVRRTKVVHLVTVETKIKGTTETAKTRSVSTKRWQITNVDELGNITFLHTIDSVDMWQKMTGRQEISYNSASPDKPPQEYEHVAATIGKPLATITIDQRGRIVDRSNKTFNPGIGDLTVPLPETPVKIGHQWFIAEEITVRMPDKTVKVVKARQKFTLVKVETGVATISVQTEILTPVNDPQVQSQLVQRMQHGTIKFDLDAGRIRSKQMDLDETVIGFSGAESIMQYLARLTEETLEGEGEPVATQPQPVGPQAQLPTGATKK